MYDAHCLESKLKIFNSLPQEQVVAELYRCCACSEWSNRVCARRPYANMNEFRDACDDEWWKLSSNHWKESFHGHPRIGDKKALAAKLSNLKNSNGNEIKSGGGWEEEEQKGTADASTDLLDAIHRGNIEYEAKYGYIFLICATNKTASEMLSQLQERLKCTNIHDEVGLLYRLLCNCIDMIHMTISMDYFYRFVLLLVSKLRLLNFELGNY